MLKKYYLPLLAVLTLFVLSKDSYSQSVGFGVYYNSPSLKIAVGTPLRIIAPHPRYIYYYNGHHRRHRGPYYYYYTHPGWNHYGHFRGRGHERHERHEGHHEGHHEKHGRH
jgi:hypothetical protein